MANFSNHPTKAERDAKAQPSEEPKKAERLVKVELKKGYMPAGDVVDGRYVKYTSTEGVEKRWPGEVIEVPRDEANDMIRKQIAMPPTEYFDE